MTKEEFCSQVYFSQNSISQSIRNNNSFIHIDDLIKSFETTGFDQDKEPVQLVRMRDDKLVSLMCAGGLLSEISEHASKDTEVQIELKDQKTPVVVRHLKKANTTLGIEESFITFFALIKE